ncbi:MAG: tandem-95 repeat protein [Pirellulaceae bacterium]
MNDLGEAETTTGTGMDDGLVTSDTLTLLRDGIPLIEGEDYRFDYQATTNQILLTPLAGLWLPGYRYEIILTNVDQFEVATGPGRDVLDAQTITITAPDPTSETGADKTVILEFESGYTVSVPQPLSLVIPSGTSGLSAIADRETFDVTNGTTRLTFEFDSTGLTTPGRIRIPFTPSSTPDEVAAAVTQALTNAGLGLAPRNLGDGVIQLGVGPNTGGNNFAIDTSLTAMVQQGVAGAVRDGGLFTITQNNVVRTFEFDTNNRITPGNVRVPISYANTQDEIADAMVTAISNATLGLAPTNIGGGRVHIGGNAPTTGAAGTVVRVNQSSLTLTGAPGIVSLDPQVDPDLQPEVITIPYQPSATVDQAAMSQLILQAIQQSSLDGLVTFVNESGELVIQGATDVVGGNALFVPGLRDIAGNALQTNQDSSPFDVRFEIDLPVEMDFGDAPDPGYATLLSSNGARHVVAENVFLGAGVNSEIDGQPNASASGDAGDDGVTFASQVVIGGNVPVSIVASTVGYVDAWIDFNADGTFDDPSERVLTSYQVSAGTNQVRLAIPSDATAGNSFARFRFSTGGQLLPTGRADNGEVEDYQVSLVAVAAPIAASDVYSVAEDATLQISAANGLLANDVDPQGDTLVPVVVNSPSNGTLTLQSDGGFTYQPDADFFGSDQFSYYVTDGVQNSETVTVDITVTSVADAPTAGNDQATVLEDSSVTVPVTANDVDPDGALDVTTVQITTPPANGSVVVNANGSVEYTPDANFFGTDTFSYTVRDQEDAVSAPAQVTISVTAVNDAPVATNDLVATRRGQSRTISLLTNDTDVDGSVDPTSIIVTRNPKSGSITLNGDGTITFTPLANFEGTDTFSYTVQDDQNATSNEATVTITVSGGNLSPIANDDAVTSRIDRPIVISVLSNDEDVDGEIVEGSVAVVQQPANGLVTVNADGTIRYTPNTAFSGADTFRYTVQDEEGLASNVAIVTVTVSRPPWQNPNDALDVNNDGFISPIDALLVINELNANGSRALDPPPIASPPFSPPPFVDVSGDDYLSPIDALLVINHLNADAAEGEAAEDEWNDSQLVGAALHITPRTTSIASQAVEQAFAGSTQNEDRPANSLAELDMIGSVFADPFVKNDLHAADSAIDADLLHQLADDLKNVWKR